MDKKEIKQVEKKLKIRFKNKTLLKKALIHASARTEEGIYNERLEFLGDAVLGLVISEFLFENHKEYDEGKMSRLKSVIVSGNSIAEIAQSLNIRSNVVVGKSLEQESLPLSIFANIMESLLGAIFIDKGYKGAKKFILRHFADLITDVIENHRGINYKAILQNYTQSNFNALPSYAIKEEKGPEHNKEFMVNVRVNEENYGPGMGKSKKSAEQQAAKIAVFKLGIIDCDNEG